MQSYWNNGRSVSAEHSLSKSAVRADFCNMAWSVF